MQNPGKPRVQVPNRGKHWSKEEAERLNLLPESGSFDFSQPKISENGEEIISENSVISTVRNFRKFTPDRVEKFLTRLSEHGVMKLACAQVGISSKCINDHRKSDPEFNEQVLQAIEIYEGMVEATITTQAIGGAVDEKFDKEGNCISRRVTYEQQLRAIILKKVNKDYNLVEKQQIGVVGGIVAIPAPQESTESWDDIVRKYVGEGSAPTKT